MFGFLVLNIGRAGVDRCNEVRVVRSSETENRANCEVARDASN